jgi:hypothetical protein
LEMEQSASNSIGMQVVAWERKVPGNKGQWWQRQLRSFSSIAALRCYEKGRQIAASHGAHMDRARVSSFATLGPGT